MLQQKKTDDNTRPWGVYCVIVSLYCHQLARVVSTSILSDVRIFARQ